MTDESRPTQAPTPATNPVPHDDPSVTHRSASAGLCTLCWRDELVWRDGGWWAEHIGPLDECSHSCHTRTDFLESTS